MGKTLESMMSLREAMGQGYSSGRGLFDRARDLFA